MFRSSSAKLLFVVFLSVVLFFPFKTFSYSDSTTHPALTDEIVDFFNLNFKDKALTAEEKEWVVRGVTEEDIVPRWINHFYDPTTGKGWTAEEMGRFSSSTAMALNKVLLSDWPPVNAKLWAEASDIQSKYKLFDGNRTWQRAIYELAKNDNKKEAYLTLGHILHLLEDVTVPDHTRNDTHAHPLEGVTGDYGSPYEEYTKRYSRVTDGTNIPINAESLFNKNFKPVVRNFLGDYFDYLAKYSNNNFFSKDTIPVYNYDLDTSQYQKYSNPKIIRESNNIGYGYDSLNNKEMPLVHIDYVVTDRRKVVPIYNLTQDRANFPILDAYFSRLSKEAITNGAGVIKLFFDEVAKVKSGEKTIEEPPKETSGIKSVLATIKQVQNVYSSSVSYITTLASKLLNPFGIQIASNNKAASQNNSELVDQPATQNPPPAPVNLPPTITTVVQTPKPPAPAPAPPAKPPVIPETVLASVPQPIEELPVQPTIPVVQPQPKPSYILAVGYVAPPSPPEPEPAPAAPLLVEETPTSTLDVLAVTSTPTSTTEVATSTVDIATTTITASSTEPVATSTISVTTTVEVPTSTPTSTISVTTTIETSTTTTTSISADIPEVIINEVAWAGTASTRANDEWFELYNNTDQDIDLTTSTGWKIFVSGKQVKLTKINNKIISAHGYYLLERHEDSVIRDIGADAIYTLSGGFNNNGEKMELFNPNNEKIDEVDASGDWFAGTTTAKYRSMERIDPTKNGSDPTNWQSNQGSRPIGRSAIELPVYGSPRQSNFGYLVLESSQEDAIRTLDIKNSPYVVWSYKVPAGKTLNIDPGVNIFMLAYGTIEINGSLNALGTQDKPVNFIPYITTTWWANLRFNNSTSTLNFVNIKKGDRVTRLFQNLDGMILAKNSNLTISNATIWDSEANAIGGTDSVFNISDTAIGATVKSNKTYGINVRGGILRLDNVSFNNVYVGVEAGNMAGPIPILEKKNISNANFINVDYIAEPLTWWNAASSTMP